MQRVLSESHWPASTELALARHFAPGTHVAVWAGNCPEWIILQFGLALAGLVMVTVNPACRLGELAYMLRQSRARGVFHQASYHGTDMAATVGQARRDAGLELDLLACLDTFEVFIAESSNEVALPAVTPAMPAMLQYTSGTTGQAKGALLNHDSVTNNARFMALTSPAITHTRLDDTASDKSETIGRALPQVEVKVIDPLTGATQPVGVPGELLTRGGENIYPREIEEVLYAHPAVAEVAVIGLPDDYWGERVGAVLTLRAGATANAAELGAFVAARLARHKVPADWYVLDTIPATASGKLQKYRLVEMYRDGALDSARLA